MPNSKPQAADVNSFQIGGSHYQSPVQHWDFTERNGLRYLEGCATKYVTRWRKKNGRTDLIKGLHYVQKLRAMFIAGTILPRRAPWYLRAWDVAQFRVPRRPTLVVTAVEFGRANDLTDIEISLCDIIATWQNLQDLRTVEDAMQALIAEDELYGVLPHAIRKAGRRATDAGKN